MGINSISGKEFLMGSSFCNPVICHDQDLIRISDGGKAVRYGDGRSVF